MQWSSNNGFKGSRRIVLDGGSRYLSSGPTGVVLLATGAFYDRRVAISYLSGIQVGVARQRRRWPAGEYQVKVRVLLPPLDAAGKFARVVESNAVGVRITD